MQTTWIQVVEMLQRQEVGSVVSFATWQVPHPRDAGMIPTTSFETAHDAEFRKYLDSATLMRVRRVGAFYHVSLVKVVPRRPQSGEQDLTPGGLVLGATALGALLGAALGGKNGVLVGALVGGMAGLAAVGLDNAKSSPETAKLAHDMFAVLAKSLRPARASSGHRALPKRPRGLST